MKWPCLQRSLPGCRYDPVSCLTWSSDKMVQHHIHPVFYHPEIIHKSWWSCTLTASFSQLPSAPVTVWTCYRLIQICSLSVGQLVRSRPETLIGYRPVNDTRQLQIWVPDLVKFSGPETDLRGSSVIYRAVNSCCILTSYLFLPTSQVTSKEPGRMYSWSTIPDMKVFDTSGLSAHEVQRPSSRT